MPLFKVAEVVDMAIDGRHHLILRVDSDHGGFKCTYTRSRPGSHPVNMVSTCRELHEVRRFFGNTKRAKALFKLGGF